jgi:hypothetical protein
MNENDLRDCFAMFAMLRIALDGDIDIQEASAKRCWRMADAMLATRNAEPEQEVGIVAAKSRRKKND